MKILKNSVWPTIMALSLMAVLVVASTPLHAAVDVGVTRAMEKVINAWDTAATQQRFPDTYGEVSTRWTNTAGGDTGWAAPTSRVEQTVDTGWDMTSITDTTSLEIEGETTVFGATEPISASDTLVRAVEVANLGNNYVSIDFSSSHLIGSGYQGAGSATNDTFTLELYYADGSHTADGFGAASKTQVTGSDGDVLGWTMGEVKTLFLVVKTNSNAANQNKVKSDFKLTDNAPVYSPSTAGDAWERGVPIGSNDQYDTQTGVFWTVVQGPALALQKSQEFLADANRTRPGDTILYRITVDNNGSDTASDVYLDDALPEYTSYVSGSASDTATVYGVNPTVEYSSDWDASTWSTTETNPVRMIRWYYPDIPAEQSASESGSLEISFAVTID